MWSVEQGIVEMTGPSRSEQWLYWKSQAVDQKNRLATIRELEKLLQSDVVCTVVWLLHALYATVCRVMGHSRACCAYSWLLL